MFSLHIGFWCRTTLGLWSPLLNWFATIWLFSIISSCLWSYFNLSYFLESLTKRLEKKIMQFQPFEKFLLRLTIMNLVNFKLKRSHKTKFTEKYLFQFIQFYRSHWNRKVSHFFEMKFLTKYLLNRFYSNSLMSMMNNLNWLFYFLDWQRFGEID